MDTTPYKTITNKIERIVYEKTKEFKVDQDGVWEIWEQSVPFDKITYLVFLKSGETVRVFNPDKVYYLP